MPGPGPEDTKRDVVLIFFGICIWDYLTSLWFEYALIRRKIRFRWQFVPYFLARYLVLTLVITSALDVFLDSSRPPCSPDVLAITILHLGLLSIVFATWNLLVRMVIIWGHPPLLVKIVFVVGLAHFALAFVGAFVGQDICAGGRPSLLGVLMFGTTTAAIEFVVLLLSLVGIKRACTNEESRLARTLKTQGIAYFVIVLCIQISTIVINIANVDNATRMWVGVSGAMLSPILSCRLVTSTISQGGHSDYSPESRTHHIECFELSEPQSRNPSAGRMTTCIDIDTTKDQSVC